MRLSAIRIAVRIDSQKQLCHLLVAPKSLKAQATNKLCAHDDLYWDVVRAEEEYRKLEISDSITKSKTPEVAQNLKLSKYHKIRKLDSATKLETGVVLQNTKLG